MIVYLVGDIIAIVILRVVDIKGSKDLQDSVGIWSVVGNTLI